VINLKTQEEIHKTFFKEVSNILMLKKEIFCISKDRMTHQHRTKLNLALLMPKFKYREIKKCFSTLKRKNMVESECVIGVIKLSLIVVITVHSATAACLKWTITALG
jgi:hypothetical protein